MAKRTSTVDQAKLAAALKAAGTPVHVKAAPRAGKLVITKDLQIKVKPAPKEKVKKESNKPNKAEIARGIFEQTLGMERKIILGRFIAEAGLSPAGANTYLANFRKATGLK